MARMLSYVALGLLVFVGLVLFYGIIAIHDIPYEISKSRNHPHQDAIHVAGWVSLFTLHVLWPFLWIWATLYRPERGWGFQEVKQQQATDESRISALQEKLDAQAERLTLLEQTLAEKSLQNGEGSL
ncbi:DUF3302 domain-containing protein [Alcanivorax sp.]|uniref:DUF3302 domain-containing protein n=2 Tax=Alcanivorax sp. TaxID=1872427 RepID=UPI003A8D4B12